MKNELVTQYKGPFVLAIKTHNAQGWPEYTFGTKPYVHRTQHAAENEARRLAREKQAEVAVFAQVCTVQAVDEVVKTITVDLEKLAGSLALTLQENNRHLDIASARYLIDAAMKKVEYGNT